MKNTGVGQLSVHSGERGLFTYTLAEGGGVTSEINGQPFTFHLMRSPLPSEFDIREMSSLDIANYLSRRLAEEEEAEALAEAEDAELDKWGDE